MKVELKIKLSKRRRKYIRHDVPIERVIEGFSKNFNLRFCLTAFFVR